MARRPAARQRHGRSLRAVIILGVLLLVGLLGAGCLREGAGPGPDAITWAVEEDPFRLQARTVVYVLPEHAASMAVFDHQAWAHTEGNASGRARSVVVPVPEHAEVVHVVDGARRPLAYVANGAALETTLPANTSEVRVASRLAVETPGEITVRHPWAADRGPAAVAVPVRTVLVLAPDWSPTGPFAQVEGTTDIAGVSSDLAAAGFPDVVKGARTVWVWDGETTGGALVDPFTVSQEGVAGDAPWAVLAALLVILVAWTLWLFRKVHRSADDPVKGQAKMGMMGHLDELRRRTTVALVVLLLASVFFFTFGIRWVPVGMLPLPAALGGALALALPLPVPSVFDNAAAQVFQWIAATMVPAGVDTIVTRPLDAAMTQIGLAIGLGVLVTFPVLFYETYAFVAPGLYPKERKVVLSAIPFVVVLFVGGALFGLMVMTPFMTKILYAYAEPLGATPFANVVDLVSFAAVFTVMFGLAFQLPAVMGLLARVGIATAAGMARYWRHAAIVIAIVSAFVTDPTLLSQIIVGTVLFLLYLSGLGLAWLMERRYQDALPHAA